MNHLDWSNYAAYCRTCGKAFRLSKQSLAAQFATDGGQIAEHDIAAQALYCIDCVLGKGSPPGEIITAHDIAAGFSKVLREWLDASELNAVIVANRVQSSPSICHSHDFCDANMAMAEAFEAYGLPTPSDDLPGSSFSLWNAAWDIARLAEFDPARVASIPLVPCGMDYEDGPCGRPSSLQVKFSNDEFKEWQTICHGCEERQEEFIVERRPLVQST